MKNIPKKIYLQHGLSKSEMKGADFDDLFGVTWAEDNINENDICYQLESQNKERIEAFFKYLCNDADVIIEAFEDFDPENVNNIIENFFFELKTNKK